MKNAAAILATVLSLLLPAAPSLAQQEVVGRVVSMTPSRIVVRSDEGDTVRLDVSAKTRFFTGDISVPVRRLLPDTQVRVTHDHGRVDAIFIKAVPK